jgi:hypothetical protein
VDDRDRRGADLVFEIVPLIERVPPESAEVLVHYLEDCIEEKKRLMNGKREEESA